MTENFTEFMSDFVLPAETALIFDICEILYLTTKSAGGAFELFVVIFFIYHIAKKTPILSSAYFSISCYGFFIDLFNVTFRPLYGIFKEKVTLILYANNFSFFYENLMLGPWQSLLSLNRFNAIVFWQNYDRFWRSHLIKLYISGLTFYPFIVGGFAFVNAFCIVDINDKSCIQDQQRMKIASGVSNVLNSVFCLILVTVTLFQPSKPDTKNIEKRLFWQAVADAILFNIYNLFVILVEVFRSNKAVDYEGAVSYNVVYYGLCFRSVIFHNVQVISLVVLSPNVRMSFWNFYKLNTLFQMWTKGNIKISPFPSTANERRKSKILPTIL